MVFSWETCNDKSYAAVLSLETPYQGKIVPAFESVAMTEKKITWGFSRLPRVEAA